MWCSGRSSCFGWYPVGEKDEVVNGIRLVRIDREQSKEDSNQNQGRDPCVLQRISLPLLKEGLCFPPFRERFLAVSIVLRLLIFSRVSCDGKGAANFDCTRRQRPYVQCCQRWCTGVPSSDFPSESTGSSPDSWFVDTVGSTERCQFISCGEKRESLCSRHREGSSNKAPRKENCT